MVSYTNQQFSGMKPVNHTQSRLIGIVLLAGTIGLLWLMHVTSDSSSRCERESFEFSVIKLI